MFNSIFEMDKWWVDGDVQQAEQWKGQWTKQEVEPWIGREADRQRNRRIRRIRRLTREQSRNSKCLSAGKLFIVTVGRAFFVQWADGTCFSAVILYHLGATIFSWKEANRKERTKKKPNQKWQSNGRDIAVSLRGFAFVSPGDLAAKRKQHEGEGGKKAVEVVLSFKCEWKDAAEEMNRWAQGRRNILTDKFDLAHLETSPLEE